jgi:hypothetical protein
VSETIEPTDIPQPLDTDTDVPIDADGVTVADEPAPQPEQVLSEDELLAGGFETPPSRARTTGPARGTSCTPTPATRTR